MIPESISQLGLAFFGLNSEIAPQYKLNLFNEIHEIVFYGQGGYTWSDTYNLPMWLRKYTYKKIKEHYDKQNEAAQKASNSSNPNQTTLVSPDGTVNKSAFTQASQPYKSKL